MAKKPRRAKPKRGKTVGASRARTSRPARAAARPRARAAGAEQRRFDEPDETRPFPRGHADILRMAGGVVGRLVFQPGWRWSTDMKPMAGTPSCRAPHFQYHVAGRLGVRMDDGTELVAGPGDVTALPPGHDAWVIGDEPVVVVDWTGASRYGRAR